MNIDGKVMKKLEWSGWRDTAPMYMGGPPMDELPACPLCGGVKPSSRARLEFSPEAIGHQKGCKIKEALDGE